jgi:adenosine deaminase
MATGDVLARAHELARRLPKVELHVHLEGTMDAALLRTLAQRHGMELDATALDPVGAAGETRSFAHFVTAFLTRMRALQTPDDWCTLLDTFLAAQQARNVKYTEAFVTFYGALRGDYVLRDVLVAMADVERRWHARGCALRLVMDTPRQLGTDVAMQLFRLAAADETGLIVGVGIGGDELLGPAAQFAEPFAYATTAGLRCTAHAGEHGGPDSVRAAVDVLGAERIGHGVAAGDHPDLLQHLRARGVSIDVCPGSNLATGAWTPQDGPHPVRRFLDAGVRIDVGSDDPGVFGTDLCTEWADLILRDGLSPHRCFEITLDSLDAAFLDDAHRARLRAHVEAELEDLRGDAAALEEALQR